MIKDAEEKGLITPGKVSFALFLLNLLDKMYKNYMMFEQEHILETSCIKSNHLIRFDVHRIMMNI